jgi:uncharacterized protein YjiK
MKPFKRFIFNVLSLLLFAAIWCFGNSGCDRSDSSGVTPPKKKITLISEKDLPFTEPSGITWSEKLQKLWVVSGGDQHIYRLDASGNVEKQLHFTGTDLEGIAFDPVDSTLWTIDEATKEITHLDLKGSVLDQSIVSYSSLVNKGPEGIAFGKDRRLYILNEREPSVLLELDSNRRVARSYQLNFASDYSDIAYDSTSNSFFILSDESAAIFIWDTQRGVTDSYALPGISNEGIAFDQTRDIFYIVNDAKARLSIYQWSY